MQFKVLGTSSGISTPERNTSGSYLKISRHNVYVFDPSEGMVNRLKSSKVNLNSVTRIYITHAHHDHYLGLFSMLSEMGMLAGCVKRVNLNIFVPSELVDIINQYLHISAKNDNFYNFVSIHDIEQTNNEVGAVELDHNDKIKSYAFVFKFEKSDRLNVKRLSDENVPCSKYVDYVNNPEYMIANPRKMLIYCGDNQDVQLIYNLCRRYKKYNITLYHEGTFTRDMYLRLKAVNKTHGHTSVFEISRVVAKLQKSQRLHFVMSHFSPRIKSEDEILDDVATGCAVNVAYDGLEFNI